MAELTMSTLIKIILGVFVIGVITVALFFFFKNYVVGFFDNVVDSGDEAAKLILSLI